MLFLKDTVIPRQSDGNLSDVDETEEIDDSKEIEDIDDCTSERSICTDADITSPPSISFTTTQKNKNKRSKKQGTGNFEQQLIDLEARKLAALTDLPTQIEDDEDMHFFKSILPYFKTMSPIQKLRVRNDIQNILIRESLPPQQHFDTTNSHNQNYILPSVSTIQSSHPIYSSTSSPSSNFQYSNDTHSSI